jgi:excisionase family DNA binding protein
MRIQETKLPDMLTRDEAAKVLRVSVMTIDRKVKSGELAHTKIGRRVLIPAEAVATMMKPAIEQVGDDLCRVRVIRGCRLSRGA